MRFIIGIGSGRTGTQSFSKLINSQKNTLCFHELNPSCMNWEGSEVTINSMLREFEDICNGYATNVTSDYTSPNRNEPIKQISNFDNINIIGDIASYYLPYVPFLCTMNRDIRIPCIRRNKEETVLSFINKVKEPYLGRSHFYLMSFISKYTKNPAFISRNHWVEHDGKKWRKDPKWDKLHPSFEEKTLLTAIESYWDYYYKKATEFERRYPTKVRIFDINDLNTKQGQINILNFCGFHEHLKNTTYHTNTTKK